jgi:hypothetical protein
VSGPIFVKVDWANNGTLTDAGDDITDRVRGAISASYGRDQVTALSPVVAGRGSLDVDNRSRNYSPRNTASPLYPNIKPRRRVVITRLVGATTYTIFYGHTDDSPINPDVEAKTVTLSLVDSLADFRGINVTTPLYQGIRTGTAVGYVLDNAGWTGGRDLDTGASTLPWWWVTGVDAFAALQDILASEGQPALMTIDATGAFVFRDRHHRLVRSASTTSQATMRGTDRAAEPVMSKGFSYSDNWQNVVNSVTLTIDERGVTDESAVWTSQELVSVDPSSTLVVLVQTSDPFQNAVVPVSGTDYTVVSGSITSVSISNTSGASLAISLTAGVGGAVLSDLQLRAQPVPVLRSYQVTATDSTSITDYGQRSMPSGSEPVWASRYDTKAIADQIVLQRKQPLPILTVRFSCQATQTTRLSKVLSLDLSDRVTVVEAETAVSGDFFVESIQHTITSMYDHEIVLGLEAVPSTPTTQFILNTSTLNGSDPLGY